VVHRLIAALVLAVMASSCQTYSKVRLEERSRGEFQVLHVIVGMADELPGDDPTAADLQKAIHKGREGTYLYWSRHHPRDVTNKDTRWDKGTVVRPSDSVRVEVFGGVSGATPGVTAKVNQKLFELDSKIALLFIAGFHTKPLVARRFEVEDMIATNLIEFELYEDSFREKLQ